MAVAIALRMPAFDRPRSSSLAAGVCANFIGYEAEILGAASTKWNLSHIGGTLPVTATHSHVPGGIVLLTCVRRAVRQIVSLAHRFGLAVRKTRKSQTIDIVPIEACWTHPGKMLAQRDGGVVANILWKSHVES
jgi:hypothetical protein